MIVPKNFRNTYEESPERLKDIVKDGEENGQHPKSKPSRDTLVKNHERHLQLLAEGNVPVRNMILPLPYPPSRASIQNNTHHKVSLPSSGSTSTDTNHAEEAHVLYRFISMTSESRGEIRMQSYSSEPSRLRMSIPPRLLLRKTKMAM